MAATPDRDGWFRFADVFGFVLVVVIGFTAYFLTWYTHETSAAESRLLVLLENDGMDVLSHEDTLIAAADIVCTQKGADQHRIVLSAALRLSIPVEEAEQFVSRSYAYCADLP